MKLIKYLVCGVLLTGSLAALTSCEDDKNYGDAPRLFSPVVKVTSSSNSLVCKWQGINGAARYQLTLLKELPVLDENGENKYETVETIEAQASPYTFKNLDWDDRYRVDIKAVGDGIESHVYKGEALTISYPTKLKSVANVIDTGVKMEWNEDNSVAEWTDVAYFNVFTRNEDGSVTPYKPGVEETMSSADEEEKPVDKDPIVAPEVNPDYYYTVTENDIKNSSCEIYGLQPATDYRVIAYNADGEYRGRRDFSTKEAEVYENPELVFDLRVEGTDTIKNDFIETLPEGATVVLQGGKQYICSGTLTFTQSIKFTTGMSLSGKAIMTTGGFRPQGQVNRIEFNNVKVTCPPGSDTSDPDKVSGKYLFGDSKVYEINEMVLESVDLTCMRGGFRLRSGGQTINNLIVNNCVVDSIGGYRFVQSEAGDTHVKNLTITNSTFSHVVGLLRANKAGSEFVKVNIANCTFAYCGAGQPLFEMSGSADQSPNLEFTLSDCIVGGNYTDKPFKGLKAAQGTIGFTNLYVTSDIQWSTNKDTGEIENPFPASENMTQKLTDIWVNPEALDFTLKSAQLPCAAAGDPRWHVE